MVSTASIAVLAATAIASASAQVFPIPTAAANETIFKFGSPTFLGSGCPAGTAAVIPSTDGQSFSVLFSQFAAQTSATTTRQRTACSLAVNVDMQPGISVGVFRVDYRGNVYVPTAANAYAQFDAEYYFAGQKGPVATKKYVNGTAEDLFLTNEVPVGGIVWSPCGASTNFRVNAAVTAYKPLTRDGDEVQIAIDSLDSTVDKEQSFHYYLTTKKC